MIARGRKTDKSAFEIIEEATDLLRQAPPAALAAYYLGAIPFVVGFLFFWADMSQSPFARRHMVEAALAMAVLFVWMKFCQAWFSHCLRAQLGGDPVPSWNLRQSSRVIFIQAMVQPSGLFLLPLALILTVPFGWLYAFYQSLTVTADPNSIDSSSAVKRAWKQAALWPGQNNLCLGIAAAFGFCVFMDVAILVFVMPALIKMFLGIETTFSRSPFAMLNSTFLSGIAALTYLCMDPLVKAIYTIRCFYGESLHSGEDLKAEFRRFTALKHATLILGATALLLAFPASTRSQAVEEHATAAQMSAEELDIHIDQVIHSPKYAWRMPHEHVEDEPGERGLIGRFVESTFRLAGRVVRSVFSWIDKLLRELLDTKIPPSNGAGFSRVSSSFLLFALLVVVISALVTFWLRVRRANPLAVSAAAHASVLIPDIADESISADQLPEEGWSRLARELLERGEFRLAMRAFYLASLAYLASRQLIGIAPFKSNRDYQNELRRRAHSIPQLLGLFEGNVTVFERIWYGNHDVNRETVVEFASNADRMKSTA